MSDIRHMLSPEEREEYDALIYDALHAAEREGGAS